MRLLAFRSSMRRLAMRSPIYAVCLTSVVLAATTGAQSPAPASAAATLPAPLALSTIPKTPAGEVLRAWFDSFNSGDSARIAAFLKNYGSENSLEAQMGFRRQTGGFDLLSIERSEPRHIEFFVRERGGPTTAVGEFELPATGSRRLVGPTLQALGPNMPVTSLRIDAAARKRVVERAAALLDSFYVFPDVAKRMGDSARARLARGAYDGYDSGMTFARHLTDDFSAISHDKHLNVRFIARDPPPQRPDSGAPPAPSPDEIARARREMDEDNCSFEKVERMEGNVGYLKFDGFADAELCAPTVAAAMTFLAGTRAMIIDLRENGGGSPKMVALVTSYLFDRRTHINDLWTRHTNSTEEFWTQDTVAGRRFGGEKPVYVLTSARTFSGAEEFTYNLKTLKRATIVGETTGGGAHPVRGRRIDDHFMIRVPFARAINPITHTNWEGVGVEPDRKVPSGEALKTALKLLGDRPPRT
jgi:hypothetical protein